MKFGIEIELISPLTRPKLARVLRKERFSVMATWADGRPSRKWQLVDDGSISCGADSDQGIEVVSPILQYKKDFVKLKRMLDVLQKYGCNVDTRCGIHVHVDVSTLTVLQRVQIGLKYARFEDRIQEWMHSSREDNGYCENSPDREEICTWFTERSYDKDRKINIGRSIIDGEKTIEFRHHHGSLNYHELRNWITFCCEFVKAAANEVKPISTKGYIKAERDALKVLMKNGSMDVFSLPLSEHLEVEDTYIYQQRVKRKLRKLYPKLHSRMHLSTSYWGSPKVTVDLPDPTWPESSLWKGIPKQTKEYFTNVANVRRLLSDSD